MNRRGFTLVELLATLVILGVIVSIVIVSFNYDLRGAKDKTEDVFIETLKDAMEMYIDSDGKNLEFSDINCTFSKTHGDVKLYKASEGLTFGDVIKSDYIPLVESELVNPANERKCKSSANVSIYRDDDYVYYYRIDVNDRIDVNGLECLEIDEGYITNLPDTIQDPTSGCSL